MADNVKWLKPDQLASFNDDTFRAELGPRRVELDVNSGEGKVITPEEAKALKENEMAVRAQGAFPTKRLILDKAERFAPKVWKLYELQETAEPMIERVDGVAKPVLDEDGEPRFLHRFVRVGEADAFEDVAELVPAQ